jgi:glucosylceramidase
MSHSSRREFLKTAAIGAIAFSSALPVWAAPGPVRRWSTYRDKRYAAADPLAWKPNDEVAADAIILDPKATRQQMLGFGAAMTDASCWVLGQMKADERAALLHEFFAPTEMAFNVCRTCIGASDYSRNVYSFDESPQPDLTTTRATSSQLCATPAPSIPSYFSSPPPGALPAG